MTIAVANRASRDLEIESRAAAIDWTSVAAQLDACGWAIIEKMLSGRRHTLGVIFHDAK